MSDTVLKVTGVSKRFGGLQALSDVGITITAGQVYGLIGPNGAGKTTFFNVITGLYIPDSGTFELGGKPYKPAAVHEAPSRAQAATPDQATIGKGLMIKGEITGTESLFIDGKVEGSITLPGNRVTVGRNGQVAASISAREIVVLGKVRGNVSATDRVDIRAEGALTGDVAAARISIEDGAFFKGGIDIRKPDSKSAAAAEAPKPTTQA